MNKLSKVIVEETELKRCLYQWKVNENEVAYSLDWEKGKWSDIGSPIGEITLSPEANIFLKGIMLLSLAATEESVYRLQVSIDEIITKCIRLILEKE